MNKIVAGAALIAGLGLPAVAAARAAALSFPLFDTCDARAGVYNVPAGDPRDTAALDSDSDGIACENADYAYVPLPPSVTSRSARSRRSSRCRSVVPTPVRPSLPSRTATPPSASVPPRSPVERCSPAAGPPAPDPGA